MSSTNTRKVRRTAKGAVVGAVALGAAVALPAFAIDRGGDGSVDVQTSAAADAPATSTTVDPAVLAAEQQKSIEESLAFLATLSPEQLFSLQWSTWTDAEREAFTSYAEYQHQLEAFYAFNTYVEGVRQAEAAKARQATPAPSHRTQSAPAAAGGSVWDSLAQCETGGNWSHPTVSGGFSGGLMFHYATWNAMGGQAYAPTAGQATRAQQIDVAQRVLSSQGWGAWPGCSAKLGLR
jgi:hypothetical protein